MLTLLVKRSFMCEQAERPHLPLRHRAHGRVLHRLGAGDDGPHVKLVHHVAVQLTCRLREAWNQYCTMVTAVRLDRRRCAASRLCMAGPL